MKLKTDGILSTLTDKWCRVFDVGDDAGVVIGFASNTFEYSTF